MDHIFGVDLSTIANWLGHVSLNTLRPNARPWLQQSLIAGQKVAHGLKQSTKAWGVFSAASQQMTFLNAAAQESSSAQNEARDTTPRDGHAAE
ncbi:MAG TPA: hypothetical protein VG167_09515 [Verrucomicrobiae bacterium]|nr:hypothetical protein [Verrucomicrobiae bacterium]